MDRQSDGLRYLLRRPAGGVGTFTVVGTTTPSSSDAVSFTIDTSTVVGNEFTLGFMRDSFVGMF